jgi:hypothetical protein
MSKAGVQLRWIYVRGRLRSVGEEELRERIVVDEKLLRRAEKALTQIKVAQGLSEDHAGVLAALRIRLKGDPGKSLEDLIDAAGDLGGPGLEDLLTEGPKKKTASLDDILTRKPKPKPEWPSG